jgi:predicted amidohydrolase
VQSKTDAANPQKNVARAIAYVGQAAAQGAQIVCLPETYPGPRTPPLDHDAVPELAACARDLAVYLIAGLHRGGAGLG